jgi:hypothetical protein
MSKTTFPKYSLVGIFTSDKFKTAFLKGVHEATNHKEPEVALSKGWKSFKEQANLNGLSVDFKLALLGDVAKEALKLQLKLDKMKRKESS